MRFIIRCLGVAAVLICGCGRPGFADQLDTGEAGRRLKAAYPDHVAAIREGALIWRDGTRMAIDDGRENKTSVERLTAPDLNPVAGTYACRVIAGTERRSTHGYGIAIDLALKHAHYWRWSKPDATGVYSWRNDIPEEIVRVFEKHGFIWGGRWYHYDTMHFEYRPELLVE